MRLPFSYILRLPSTFCLRGQNAWEQFLSTHPAKECDDIFPVFLIGNGNFNPRTLQESATIVVFEIAECLEISIHAPYKRVRPSCREVLIQSSLISIHAPYKRVRLDIQSHVAVGKIISIHAPYKRVRPRYSRCIKGLRNFNPRTLQESATQSLSRDDKHVCDFNPRTLQESATYRCDD